MLLRRAATFLTPAPRTTPDEWARQREYAAATGRPGPRDPTLTAYLIPFARKAHEATHRRVVAVTAAQSGKTDNILDIMGARLDQRPAPILYTGPSKDFVRTQFEPRLMELLEQAKTLAAKVTRGKRLTTLLKHVAGVRIRLGFAGSSTTLKSDPFALGIVDEYDEMTANIKGQGDPLGLVEARGDTYADFVTVVTSTPSQGVCEKERDPTNGLEYWKIGDPEQIKSPIWRLFQQGTRHHFAWPCPHCGGFFIPRFEHLAWPKGATPHRARREAYLVCPVSGCIIEEGAESATKLAMIRAGVQVAPGQTIDEAREGRNEPDNSTWSCWTSGLCSPFVTWGERAERYLNALNSGEEDKIQTVMNAGFGELYVPGLGADVPSWEKLLEHRRIISHNGAPVRLPGAYARYEVPREVLRLTAGVDVQKRSLVYVIRGWGARGTSWLIDHGYLYGDTDKQKVWDDLTLLMGSPISGLIIERVFIDSGYRPDKPDAGNEHRVYEWARLNSHIAMPTKGRNTLNGKPYSVAKIEYQATGKPTVYSIDLVHLNTDFFKSLVHKQLKTPLDQLGAFYLHDDADEDYARQVLSEHRVLLPGAKPEWQKLSKDNHYFDAETMAAAAGYILNVHTIPEGIVREDEPTIAPPPGAPALPNAATALRDKFRNMGQRAMRS